jgi:LacI family transcriptional regulator
MSKVAIPKKEAPAKRASMREVAKRAATSPMTVSRVLRGQVERIAPETCARVLRAAQELDYKPVAFSTQNRQVRTHTVGAIIIHVGPGHMGRMTFDGLSQATMNSGYDLLVRALPHRLTEDESEALLTGGRLLDRLLDRRCDGYVFLGYAPYLVEWLCNRDIPVVSCYSDLVPEGVPIVIPDHLMAMRQAVGHLHAQGHRRIGHLAGPNWNTSARLRVECFCQATAEYGLSPDAAPVSGDTREGDDWGMTEAGIEATQELLRHNVTAIIAARDLAAVQLKTYLTQQGIRIPTDLSIIGIDNDPIAAEERLTTVDQSFDQVGSRAFEALQQIEEGINFTEPILVPTRLILRDSVAPPRLWSSP